MLTGTIFASVKGYLLGSPQPILLQLSGIRIRLRDSDIGRRGPADAEGAPRSGLKDGKSTESVPPDDKDGAWQPPCIFPPLILRCFPGFSLKVDGGITVEAPLLGPDLASDSSPPQGSGRGACPSARIHMAGLELAIVALAGPLSSSASSAAEEEALPSAFPSPPGIVSALGGIGPHPASAPFRHQAAAGIRASLLVQPITLSLHSTADLKGVASTASLSAVANAQAGASPPPLDLLTCHGIHLDFGLSCTRCGNSLWMLEFLDD